jgi:hypothetical protein
MAIEGEVDVDDGPSTRSMRAPDKTPATMIVQQTPSSGIRPTPAITPSGLLPMADTALAVLPTMKVSALERPHDGSALAASSMTGMGAVELTEPANLLREDRRKRLLRMVLVVMIIAAAIAGIVVIASREPARKAPVVAEPHPAAVVDAAVIAVDDPGLDAGQSRDDIIALSRFGFFSVDASAKTVIYIDGKRVGEAPLTRYPVPPGIHKVKAVGPRNKTQRFDIEIYGGKDTDHPTLEW